MTKFFTIRSCFVLAFIAFVFGCETEKIVFKGPYHIRFTDSSTFSKESFSEPIKIEVHNVGPALDEDVTINYTITGNARRNIDYSILNEPGQVVIKAGEYFGYIEMQLINNANNILRSQDIVFTLQSVSTGQRKIGQGKSAIGKSFTYTIFDDCILGGTYTGTGESVAPVEDITISSQDCETYTLSNWNIGVFNNENIEMDLIFTDNGDNTITIPTQEEEMIVADEATIEGTGIVDPVTREILMTVKLIDVEDQPEISFTLQPN